MFGLGTTPPRIATVLRDAVGSFLSTYRTNNVTPELVADFNGSLNKGVEGYAAGKDVDTFAELITHSRAGNATMTDGYGPELVTNGGFTSDSDWTKNTGVTISGGQAHFAVSTFYNMLSQTAVIPVVGKTYEIVYEVTSVTDQNIRFVFGGLTGQARPTVGTFSQTITAVTTSSLMFIGTGLGFTGSIDNVSVREVPAIKWAPHNLLTYSEDLSNAAWTKFNISVSTSTGVAPDGNNTANKITETNTNGIHGFRSNAIPETINSFSVFAKEAERRYCVITLGENNTPLHGGGITVDLRDGSVLSFVGTELLNYSVLDAGNGWYQLSITTEGTGIGGSNFPFVWIADNSGHVPGLTYGADTYQGDGVSGIYLWGVHAYRSDLGGMVDNPETGDSYVRTAGIPTGSNLIINGDFSTDSDWTKGAGVTIAGGVASFNSASGTLLLQQNLYAAQKSIVVQVTISNYTSGILRVQYGVADSPNLSGNGTYEFSIVGFNSNTYLNFYAIGGSQCVLDIDNVSVKETDVNPAVARYLPRRNHHVYNGDDWVNEGILHESEARTNLVTYSQDFSSWPHLTRVTVASAAAAAPDGTLSADIVTATVDSNNSHFIYQDGGGGYASLITFSVWAKAGTYGYFSLDIGGLSVRYAIFDLLTGTLGDVVGTGFTARMEKHSNGWYRCSITGTYSATSTNPHILFNGNSTNIDYVFATAGTESIYLWGAQLEEGTPSSVIPTNSATVTRAAETLTIPAANMPWPEPNYLGPELVVNGDFSTDSNWVKGAGWSISNSTASHVAGTASSLLQAVSLTTGKLYRASCYVVSCSGGSGSIQFRDGGTSTFTLLGSQNAGQTVEVLYVAEGNLNVSIATGSLTNLVVDNVSVREIDPLSVSIQMQGRMTYADEDSGSGGIDGQLDFFFWSKDVNNLIKASLHTSNIRTGMPQFVQRANGVLEIVNDNQYTTYSPGVLVPYNIAGRHGSTFINGAIDGVAFTADTTPVALPDLSATDFNLGYDYMGTISMLRVWADDLADAGIVEATEPSEVPSLQLTFDNSQTSFTIQDWEQ